MKYNIIFPQINLNISNFYIAIYTKYKLDKNLKNHKY